MKIDADLLEVIYRTALRPQSYDTLMQEWESRLDAYVSGLSDDAPLGPEGPEQGEDGAAVPYLQTTLNVMKSLDRSAPAATGEARWSANAKVLICRTGKILWHNRRAETLFGTATGAALADLQLDPGTRNRIVDALQRLELHPASPEGSIPRVIRAAPDGAPDAASAAVYMLASRMEQPDGPEVLYLEETGSSWSEGVEACLRDSFDLTASEMQVLAGLCEGQTIAQIAKARGRSVSTLRTQVKSVLRKTGVSSQSQVVRLAYSLAAHVDTTARGGTVEQSPVWSHRMEDGRLVPVHDLGPRSGRPVLFLHGMLDGMGALAALEPELHRRDLRLIAPERPHFGSAPGCGRPVRDMVGAIADDMLVLLDHLGLDRVAVLGHMAGAVYAFGLASRAPGRVSRVVSVAGGVPIRSIRQFKDMSRRQRTIAYSARFLPRTLPVLLHAGVRQIQFGGIRNFVEALYAQSPPDRAVLTRPDAAAAIENGVKFAVNQGYRGFEIDSYHVVRDWSANAEDTPCPIDLVHGSADPVVSFASVEDFARRLGQRCRLHRIEGAGQLILHDRPDVILDCLAA